MHHKRLVLGVLSACALALAGCGAGLQTTLSEEGARAEAIETLLSEPSARAMVVDRLLTAPEARNLLYARIVESEQASSALVKAMMDNERARAVAATQIASDTDTTRTFIGMMMLTGGVGTIMSREQADCLELGDALAHGNQRSTMVGLKRLGSFLDEWAKGNGGRYPVCDDFEDVTECLTSKLPAEALSGFRLEDAWGRPFVYHSDEAGGQYALISYATDGRYDELGRVGPTTSYNADIVYADGDFVQWPAHIAKEQIR